MRVLLEDGGFEVAEEILGRAAVKRTPVPRPGFVTDSADAATLGSSVRVALQDRRRPA